MYLKKLELSGFKSFAAKTVLDFLPSFDESSEGKPDQTVTRERGITAIVGPNGSGKSNIADAIRWAIGEQSSKNLRGKKAEDVIFAGTDQKTRLGSAPVTLIFDNHDKRIPVEFLEVAITRKVYRSGESEYQINGSKVRLMDVVDLLAKAGIGRDSYCVITQGMSDALLQATPAERRTTFEDAAGVKQFQIEKERALRKLESTRENIAQVETLTREIEPHLKNLRRQADKAAQGKELEEKLRTKRELLYGFLWSNFEKERGGVMAERESLEKRITSLEEETKSLAHLVQSSSQAMQTNEKEDDLEKELSEIREALNMTLRDLSIQDGKKEIELEKRREREKIQIIPVDLKFVQAKLEDLGTLHDELLQKIGHVERLEDLQEIKEFAAVIRTRLADLKTQAEKGSVEEKKTLSLSVEEEKEERERMEGIEKTIHSLKEKSIKLEDEVVKKTDILARVREQAKGERSTFFSKEAEWRERERLLTGEKDKLNELKVGLARIEVREEDLTNLVKEELGKSTKELMYDGTPVERERLEREIVRLKLDVEQAGSIDPLVMEEYKETEERFGFLSRESEDLKNAIGSLQKVIKEMDEKIDASFRSAFVEINKKFSEYFKIIFGGGKAELSITKIKTRQSGDSEEESDEDEEAERETAPEKFEIGIEIVASPPGKRIHNLSMLSGGERSLTSLALLFAIISHNPPPFAVLDEVEAALDEANSRRFGNMLRELSQHTQFIAITHNRETMTQANLLYGVTMSESGVSKLLSVRLDQVESGKKQ